MSKLDECLQERLKLETEYVRVKTALDDIDAQINALAGDDKASGVVNVVGTSLVAKITRRLNITYSDKEKLAELVMTNEELRPLFRMELRESGTKVCKWLQSDSPLTAALKAIRVETQGKPSVTIEPKKEEVEQ